MNTTLILLLGFIGAGVAYFAYAIHKMKKMPKVANHPSILQLNDADFSRKISSGIVLVDFWAEWCMPCKMMIPILNEVATEAPENAKVAKLNVDHARQTAAKYHVRSIPTMIVFKNGKEVKRIVGVKPKGYILNQLSNS